MSKFTDLLFKPHRDCPSCGSYIPKGSFRCPDCGQKLICYVEDSNSFRMLKNVVEKEKFLLSQKDFIVLHVINEKINDRDFYSTFDGIVMTTKQKLENVQDTFEVYYPRAEARKPGTDRKRSAKDMILDHFKTVNPYSYVKNYPNKEQIVNDLWVFPRTLDLEVDQLEGLLDDIIIGEMGLNNEAKITKFSFSDQVFKLSKKILRVREQNKEAGEKWRTLRKDEAKRLNLWSRYSIENCKQ